VWPETGLERIVEHLDFNTRIRGDRIFESRHSNVTDEQIMLVVDRERARSFGERHARACCD
jgi:hypothetical protein